MNGKILHWSYREFHEIPEALLKYGLALEEIYLKENFISQLPAWLPQLANLRFIQLNGNVLQDLPDALCDLDNLEHLDVSNNRLVAFPARFSNLKKLRYLCANDNRMETMYADFHKMKSLESLHMAKNRLTEIPTTLAKSTTICEMFFGDNLISEIPMEILSMQTLTKLDVDRCCLECLPTFVSPRLTYLRVFNNPKLRYYPLVYERFLHNHYDYWSENVISADSLMIFSPDISKHIVLPSDINIILSDAEPCSLVEVTLRTLHRHQRFFDNLADDSLPKTFYKILQRGPVAVCSYEPCKSPIFLQCHFSLIRKRCSVSHIIFSVMFCGGDCSIKWHEVNKAKYYRLSARNG